MQIAELDDVQYDLEVDGEQVRKQLARKIWEERGWATVAVVFQERSTDGEWKPPKLAVLRFRRLQGVWKRQAALTLRGSAALALVDTVGSWRDQLVTDGDDDTDDE